MKRTVLTFLLLSIVPSLSFANTTLEIVKELNIRPANIAVSDTGRIFFSQHPLDSPSIKVVELQSDGKVAPYPNEKLNDELGNVIGIKTIKEMLWLLDMGSQHISPQMVGWDIQHNNLVKKIPIPASVRQDNSFLQDMAIDAERQIAYIADMTRGDLVGVSKPAIISIDLKSGEARRLLEGHPTFAPGEPIKIDQKVMAHATADGKVIPLQLGLNPITISPDNQWVYYGSVNGKDLWRISAQDLANRSLSDAALAAKPERYATKANSDGIVADNNGHVYITDIEAHGIGIANDKEYRLLAQDKTLLSWADGLAIGPDNYLYATVNQLHKHSALNSGIDDSKPPYFIIKVKL
ncbi:MAG: L-dopachrome tautomerase-related protein [Aeromonadaceae bacterium]